MACALFVALRFLLARLRERTAREKGTLRAPEAPALLFGLDVRPEALPTNLAELAAQVASSDPRLALSLLYRGALVKWKDRKKIGLGSTQRATAKAYRKGFANGGGWQLNSGSRATIWSSSGGRNGSIAIGSAAVFG